MASSKETYCLCGQPYNVGQFMIECDCCREWFHGSCVNVKIYQSDDIDKYHCPKCAQTYGPSVLKVPTNNHRADRYEIGSETRGSQAGSPSFVRALAARPLRPTAQASTRAMPHQFTEELIKNNGFTKPVVFSTPDGLDLKMPNAATFTVRSVLRFCGAQLDVEVIDVRKQATLRMPLGDFVEYFETPPEQREEKVLNILSLEFSDTPMSALVEPPAIARKLDWALRVWPVAKEGLPRPSVQKYCLMSAGGSYTDFHVDFGGTTVWYHVLHGRKIFFLIPPTSTNLALYQQWSASNNQNERFFGDLVEWYGTTELLPGETLFIPAGWIHAVLSPDDCLVFGGNLLHEYSIEMQLQIYEIERRVETPILFRYPLFETMHWYAGSHLLVMLRRHNEDTQDEDYTIHEREQHFPPPDLPPLLVRGIRILANALKEWHALKTSDQQKRDNVPKCLNSSQIVKDLCKELRTLEKRSPTSNNKDKDSKLKIHPVPAKSQTKKHSTPKKPIKLTLPKPIMHMTPQNGEYPQEKIKEEIYQTKFAEKDLFQDPRYVQPNGLQDCKMYNIEGKEIIHDKGYTYQNFDEQYQTDGNGYVERLEKKNGGSVLRIKLNNNSSSSSREDPPPYSLPEHSILKSHLIGRTMDRPQSVKPTQQWTISKKDVPGDYHEEQILFTNENLPANIIENQDINYGPGMYSTEDIQPDYHYSESAKPGSYQPDYSYQNQNLPPELNIQYQVDPNGYVNGRIQAELEARYDKNYEMGGQIVTQEIGQIQSTSYITVPVQQEINGYHQEQLPSYDAAIAQQYSAGYIIEEPKPPTETVITPPTPPVRRSERPVRRRVSPTYDYEDGDLYIDETPAPARRKAKHKHCNRHSVSNSAYRQSQQRAVPANGIESLIQASVLAEEPEHNTEDAAAAMLSISEQYTAPPVQARTFGLANNTPQDLPNKRARKSLPTPVVDEEDEDIIKEVHRDEEYVYPSLEMSSEDDEDWSSPRRRRLSRNKAEAKSRSEKDESWSPRARLGRLVPRARGPQRANVRRECVRAALNHAASSEPHHTQLSAKRSVLANKIKRPPLPPPTSPNSKNKAAKDSKQKKGMKTAKQRLGKILKIHKMMY